MTNPIDLVTAYLSIQAKIKEQRQLMSELKAQEKIYQLDLCNYINDVESETNGLRIDSETVLTVVQKDKKVPRAKKDYITYLNDLCANRGLESEEFVQAIIQGKTETVIPQPILKVVKNKR